MTEFKTILLIEDDHFISDMYKRALDSAGYQTVVEANGAKALALALSQKFDLILLDIMIPELNGKQILDKLHTAFTDIPEKPKIIIMTNFDQPDSERIDMESKTDGYLIKADVTPSDLLAQVQNILNNNQ